jgi:large subunit ribosomal protein L15e
VVRIKAAVGVQEVAERRVAEKYPNLTLLNSYPVFRDGRYAWYEVLLVDSTHPSVEADQDLRWLRSAA